MPLKQDRRDRDLRRRYHITAAEYDRMLADQGGVCWICGAPCGYGGRRLAVDHCHKTGKVRGLLCTGCNVTLGRFQDRIELIERALEYLVRFA